MQRIALTTKNETDRIALRGVRLRSRLTGLCQRTTIEQTFVNQEDRDIEAVYTFPLPDNAAVCGFEVLTGDRILTGQIEEKEEAAADYDDAIAQGHGAFLLEANRPDIFTAHVGNLKPHQAATIRLSYVSQLSVVDRSIRVLFPTTVAPRYVTASGGRDPLDTILDGDAINPPHVLYVPYGLSAEIEIDLGRRVEGISSPSHGIEIQQTPETTYRITFPTRTADMDRDVVLNIDLGVEQQPRAQCGLDANGYAYLAVTFVPEFEQHKTSEPQPSEVVFMVDCSGSMMGNSIHHARGALALCLRSLSEGDRFNIYRFGSTYESLAPQPLVYSAATLQQALDYIDRIEANLGGTELLAPLQDLFDGSPATGQPRQVILLTDGQISNEVQVIDLAHRHRAENRLFTFGIGAASSSHLVNSLARITAGAAEFVHENEAIEDKVLRTLSRMASPMVSEVKLDWHGAHVEMAPGNLPPVFDGDALTVFGRVDGAIPQRVTLTCKTKAEDASWDIDVGASSTDEGLMATLWAHAMIKDIETIPRDWTETYQLRDIDVLEQIRVVDLSKQYGVLCSLTTFMAVEHRSEAERSAGRPALRRVPVMLAHGWHGIDGVAAGVPGRSLDSGKRDACCIGYLCDPESASSFETTESAEPFDVNDLYDLYDELCNRHGLKTDHCRDLVNAQVNLWIGDALKHPSQQIFNTMLAILLIHWCFDTPRERVLWRHVEKKAVPLLAKNLKIKSAELRTWLKAQESQLRPERVGACS